MSKFDKFVQSPKFLQAVETSNGAWSRYLENHPELKVESNRAGPKERAENAKMAEELKQDMGGAIGWAGLAVGGLTLLTGGGLTAAAVHVAGGFLGRAAVNAAANVSERQHNDPDTHLRGVNTMGGWIAKSYIDTLKELPKQIKPTMNQFRAEIDMGVNKVKEGVSSISPRSSKSPGLR